MVSRIRRRFLHLQWLNVTFHWSSPGLTLTTSSDSSFRQRAGRCATLRPGWLRARPDTSCLQHSALTHCVINISWVLLYKKCSSPLSCHFLSPEHVCSIKTLLTLICGHNISNKVMNYGWALFYKSVCALRAGSCVVLIRLRLTNVFFPVCVLKWCRHWSHSWNLMKRQQAAAARSDEKEGNWFERRQKKGIKTKR